MNNLFLFILLASIVLLVVGLIKPALVIRWGDPEKVGRKKVLITYLGLTVVSFIAFGLTTDVKNIPKDQQSIQTTQPATPEPVQAPKSTPTLEQQIESTAKDSGKQIKSINILPDDGSNKRIVEIHVAGKENLTPSMMRKGAYSDGASLFEKMFTSGLPLKEVREFIYLPLTDKYGNTKDDIVVKMTLKEETAAKINWKGVNKLEFNKVTDNSWTHPALLKD